MPRTLAMAADLRTSIIVDYQNVHLTGHGVFDSFRHQAPHLTLIDPLMFAIELLRVRNRRQKPGMAAAILERVLVFRGQPSPVHDPGGYGRNLAQKSHWERDSRVTVTLRPLKYEYQRDAAGRVATDDRGRKIPIGKPQEKGVDVLCALAAVREARDPAIDLVVLASSDTDLAPVLDDVRRDGRAKIETFCWFDERLRIGYQIHPTDRSRPVWNTRLGEASLRRCIDPTDYSAKRRR